MKNIVVGTLLMLSAASTIASIQETQLVGDWHCTRADELYEYESWYKLSSDKKAEYYLDMPQNWIEFSKKPKSTFLREIHRGSWAVSGNQLTVTVKLEEAERLYDSADILDPINREIEANIFNDYKTAVENVDLVAMPVEIKKVTENTMSIRGYGEEVDSMCKKVK